jgi:shikimate dehydrogenase
MDQEATMKRFGLIGHPLGHSMSPLIHTRIMEMAGIDGTYELFPIEPSRLRDEVPRLLRELDGFNCTIPHKEKLAEILGTTGAVNTVFCGKGYNTDTAGFRTCGFDFAGKDVLLLGAGGTAWMMAQEVLRVGAKSLTICARRHVVTSSRLVPYEEAYGDSLRADIILNSTPLGMHPRAYELPCATSLLRPGVNVFDAIYNPTPTRLVLNARKHGATAIGGLHMLVRQAIEAQKIWNPEKTFDVEKIEAAILPEVSRELLRHSPIHILLTGFMGAGKSSLAKELAAQLGIAHVDIDAEIEKQTNRSISDIFQRDGEPAFRAIERDVALRAVTRGSSSVVAAGGGLPIS